MNIASASIATIVFTKYYGDAGVTISTIVMTIVVLIFGEISPKSLSKESPEKFAMFSTPILKILMIIFTPLNFLFGLWKNMMSKVIKVEEIPIEVEDELLTMVEEAEIKGGIDEHESKLIRSAIEFNDLDADQILTSRVDMISIPKETTMEDVRKVFKENKFSRIPVYENNIDNIIGVIHEKDFYDALDEKKENISVPDFIRNICMPMNDLKGDNLPVSAFIDNKMEDGTFMHGTTKYEKRGIAVNVPEWIQERCIQCNQCSYVCPHACIRPFLSTEDEFQNAPESFKKIDAKGVKVEVPYFYTIGVTPLDCTGCANCAEVCPAPGKALIMKPIASQANQIEAWNFAINEIKNKKNPMKKTTVKGSQFEQPLLEFSGACAGCGETPYAKLVTQLFGDRMIIANATGCSSIWASSGAATAYTKNQQGYGPAWANSLFEDNAEYGLGMFLGTKTIRERIASNIEKALKEGACNSARESMEEWLNNKDIGEGTRERAEKLEVALQGCNDEIAKEILKDKEYFIKTSQWIFGGDGWAYDIGYGGLDHVLASNEDVNVLVFDTEIYSNTGGQSSKSTPTSAIAKFAAAGKRTKKKDLGMMAMSYGYVYVAQIAIGADKNQAIKAISEAESYNGPSLIIAYSPCINHGIKGGMTNSPYEQKKAVDCGYWNLYRYNPSLKGEKNPFTLDSKEPKADFKDFLMGEIRYASLAKVFPELAEQLFEKTEKDAKERLESYKRLAQD